MIRGISERTRLTAAFVLLLVIVGGVGMYQAQSVGQVRERFLDVVSRDLPRQNKLHEMKIATDELEKSVVLYNQSIQSGEKAVLASKKAEITAKVKLINEVQHSYQSLFTEDSHNLDVPVIGKTLSHNVQAVVKAAENVVDIDNPAPAQVTAGQSALIESTTQLSQNIDDLLKLEASTIKTESAEVTESALQLQRFVWLSVASALLAAFVYGLLSFFLGRSLRQLQQGVRRIANGDFSRQIPTTSANREVRQLAETFNDMADRLRDSYRRLSVETERDRIMLESLGEGVVAIDEKKHITLINKRAVELLELKTPAALIGKVVDDVFSLLDENNHPLAAAETPAALALEKSQTVQNTYHYQREAGAKIIIDLIANPILVEDKLSGAVMNLRDVTKEREVDRMKTEFISLASHQLRTPLSAIKWFTEMLVSGDAGELKPEQADFARNIANSTERMIALVNALLNISRIESGRIMIDPKPTDLRELVSGIVNDLKAKTEEKQQTLIISVHEDLPKISLDPRLIGQVYLNLLTNAIKYTQKGGEISVFISKKGDDVISQVTDNGYGIPKEQQGRIFQKFFRAANAVKVETDGTGLGLYLIKAVIESSGGKIWFESTEGKGTTFWFSIPLSGMRAKEGEVTLDA